MDERENQSVDIGLVPSPVAPTPVKQLLAHEHPLWAFALGAFVALSGWLLVSFARQSQYVVAGVAGIALLLGLLAMARLRVGPSSTVAAEQVTTNAQTPSVASASTPTPSVPLDLVQIKTDFLTRMSHEVQPPLNNILGTIALVLRSPRLESEDRRFLESAHISATSLLAVVDDILDLSKLEAGDFPIVVDSFEPRPLVLDVAELAASALHTTTVQVLPSVATEVPPVLLGDLERTRQILVNLVSNAVKFTPKGQISIRLTVVHSDAESGRFRFEVEDTGIGVRPSDRDKLFEPFVTAAPKERRQRTGLGLAVCKHLAERMGGELGFESTFGKGSLFWVELPFGISPVSVREVPLQRRRILVADANPTVRQVVRVHLEHWGLECVDVADMPGAVAASEYAGRTHMPFSAAVLAVEVVAEAPKRLLDALRTQPGQEKLPLILLSHPTSEAAPVDAAFCLRKPLRTSELYNALAQLFLAKKRGPGKFGAFQRSKAEDRIFELLVVEDNPINQLVATEIIEELGHRCTVVGNGAIALETLERAHFDAVLMDCQMPGMDGYEATRRIRLLPGPLSKIPIFALTAHALVGERASALAAGMDDYLSKPLSESALLRLLRLWLPTQRGHLPLIDPTVRRSPRAIDLFQRTIGSEISAMGAALRQQDPVLFRSCAHRAKSSALAIGAERLAYTCKELQDLCDGQSLSRSAAEELIQVVKDELSVTLGELANVAAMPSLLSPARNSFSPSARPVAMRIEETRRG